MTKKPTAKKVATKTAKEPQAVPNTIFIPIRGTTLPEERAQWKAMGVVLGNSVDRLLREAALPTGWKIQKTDHYMWKDLVDEQGRKRASIMHKAAFYDQDASITILPRFQATYRYADKGKDVNKVYGVVTDSGEEVFKTKKMPWTPTSHAEATDKAIAWLTERGYTDYKNPLAYW